MFEDKISLALDFDEHFMTDCLFNERELRQFPLFYQPEPQWGKLKTTAKENGLFSRLFSFEVVFNKNYISWKLTSFSIMHPAALKIIFHKSLPHQIPFAKILSIFALNEIYQFHLFQNAKIDLEVGRVIKS